MPLYHWRARRWNSESESEGQLEADSLADATSELRRQSYEVLSVQLEVEQGLEGAQKLLEIRNPEKVRPDVFRAADAARPGQAARSEDWGQRLRKKTEQFGYAARRYWTRQGWNHKDRALFFRQLALLLGAGVRLHRAFKILSDSQSDPLIAARLQAVPEQPCFDDGLRQTGLLNAFELAQVEAALENSTLPETFHRLADQVEQWHQCQRNLWMQLSTPITALTLCWLLLPILGRLVGILMTALSELEPSPTTRQLAWFLQSGWWLLLGWGGPPVLLLLAKHAGERFLASQSGRQSLLQAPLLGRLWRAFDLSISLKIFSDLYEGGILLDRALELTQRNSMLDCWSRMLASVKEGGELSAPLFLPEDQVLRHTMKAGEESGKLGLLCAKMQMFYEDEANATMRTLTALLEPAVTVLVSLVVGSTCWICLSPILRIAQSL